jgi:hypothetical protein
MVERLSRPFDEHSNWGVEFIDENGGAATEAVPEKE